MQLPRHEDARSNATHNLRPRTGVSVAWTGQATILERDLAMIKARRPGRAMVTRMSSLSNTNLFAFISTNRTGYLRVLKK